MENDHNFIDDCIQQGPYSVQLQGDIMAPYHYRHQYVVCMLYGTDEIWYVRRQKIFLPFSVWQKQLGNFVTFVLNFNLCF